MIEFPVSEKQGIARQSIAMIAFFADIFNANCECSRSSPEAGSGSLPADSLYQHLLLTAEKKFWRCVESGAPRIFGVEPPRPARTEHPHPGSPSGLFRMEAAPV